MSPCGKYRYELRRRLTAEQPYAHKYERKTCFIMLNPSTADANKDDPTIRRCTAFAHQWGTAELIVVNLFAFRATEPKQLFVAAKEGLDIIGPENDSYIRHAVEEADNGVIVCAWGQHGHRYGREQDVVRMLHKHDPAVPLTALKLAKNGTPYHPLYLPLTSQPWPWKPTS